MEFVFFPGKLLNIKGYKVEIVRKLGYGSFGVVYLVKDVKDGKEYAMKASKLENVETEYKISRLMSQSCNNKFPKYFAFVKYFERYSDKGYYLILMEYLKDGKDMLEWMEHNLEEVENKYERQFTTKEYRIRAVHICRKMVLTIAQGIKCMLDNGYMHNDIKPENIMVFDNEKKFRLVDFGLSCKVVENDMSYSPCNGYGSKCEGTAFVGSPRYAALEEYECERNFSKSEMWALGVTLYYIIFVEFPFVIDEILGKTFMDPSSNLQRNLQYLKMTGEKFEKNNAWIVLYEIISNLLQIKPDDRITVYELVDYLEELE